VFFACPPCTSRHGVLSCGYMINVYEYVEGEKDMIYGYICILDLCSYIVARDNHEK
jgi:hypothetical protein